MIGRQYLTNLNAFQKDKSTFKDLYLIKEEDYDEDIVKDYIDEYDKKYSYVTIKFMSNIENNLNVLFDKFKNIILKDLSSLDIWLLFLKIYFNINDNLKLDKCIQFLLNGKDNKSKILDMVSYLKTIISEDMYSRLSIFNTFYTKDNEEVSDILKKSILEYIDKYRIIVITFFERVYDKMIRLNYRYVHNFDNQFDFNESLYINDFKDIIINKIRYNLIPDKYLKYFFVENIINFQKIQNIISNALSDSEYKVFVNYIQYRFIYEFINNMYDQIINEDVSFDSPEEVYDYIVNKINNNNIIKDSLNSAILKFKEFSDLIIYNRFHIVKSDTIKENLTIYTSYTDPLYNYETYNKILIIPELYEAAINLLYCPSNINQTYMFNNINILDSVINYLNNKDNINIPSSPENTINLFENYSVLLSGYVSLEEDEITNNIKDIVNNIYDKIDDINDAFINTLNNEYKTFVLNDFKSKQLKDISLFSSKIIYDIIIQNLYNFSYGFFASPLINSIQDYSSTDYEYIESSISHIVYNVINKKSAYIYSYIVDKILGIRESINENELSDALDKIYQTGSNIDLTNLLNIVISPIVSKTFIEDFDFSIITNDIKHDLYDFCITNIPSTDFRYDLEVGNIEYFSNFNDIVDSFVFNIKNRINFDLIKSIHSIKHSIIGNTDNFMKSIDNTMYYVNTFRYMLNIIFYEIIFIRSGLVNFMFSNKLKKDIYTTIENINFGEGLDLLFDMIVSDIKFKEYINLINDYIIL